MKLLGTRVVFEEILPKKEKTKSVILLPGQPEEQPPFIEGKVIAAGDESIMKVGQKLLVNRSTTGYIIWEEQKRFMVVDEEIIAKDK